MYLINNKTMALVSNNTGYFRTKIIEENNVKHSSQHPIKILDYNCIKNGSSIDGRKVSVKSIIGNKSKLPIPIQPKKGLYMFPTTSIHNHNCIWFSYFHIQRHKAKDKRTQISFENNDHFFVNVSFNQFDLQMKRTSQVIAYFYKILYLT